VPRKSGRLDGVAGSMVEYVIRCMIPRVVPTCRGATAVPNGDGNGVH
jgi:hypothetical protein